MSEDKELMRAHDIAHQIAVSELLRFMLGEMAFDKDPEIFAQRLRKIEDVLVTNLSNRRLYDEANDYTEAVVKESASGYITRLIASIRHPNEPSGDGQKG